MSYEVWAGGERRGAVSSARDLDAVLDEVALLRGDEGAPMIVTILPIVEGADIDEIPGLEVGVGHPERASLHWTEVSGYGSGHGVEPGVDEWPQVIGFDYSGQWTGYEPARTRVRTATARQAAREYVASGHRPTCIRWPNSEPGT